VRNVANRRPCSFDGADGEQKFFVESACVYLAQPHRCRHVDEIKLPSRAAKAASAQAHNAAPSPGAESQGAFSETAKQAPRGFFLSTRGRGSFA
jgi:hypothetical protein